VSERGRRWIIYNEAAFCSVADVLSDSGEEECEEIDATQVIIHDSTAQTPVIQRRHRQVNELLLTPAHTPPPLIGRSRARTPELGSHPADKGEQEEEDEEEKGPWPRWLYRSSSPCPSFISPANFRGFTDFFF
jgi:hypothetical protein